MGDHFPGFTVSAQVIAVSARRGRCAIIATGSHHSKMKMVCGGKCFAFYYETVFFANCSELK